MPTDAPIPKILYQTWETRELSPKMAAARATWLEKNPDWTHVLADKDDRRALVESHSPEALKAYDRLKIGAFKADLWRYCQLYKTGGVYADIDSVCVVPLDDYLEDEDRFVAAAATAREDGSLGWVVANGLLCVRPGHPFLKRVIERGIEEILAGEVDGFYAIGPSGLGISINQVLGREPKAQNRAGRHDGYRLLEKKGIRFFNEGTCVFLAEYEGYKDDLKDIGAQHWRDEMKTPSLLDRLKRKLRG